MPLCLGLQSGDCGSGLYQAVSLACGTEPSVWPIITSVLSPATDLSTSTLLVGPWVPLAVTRCREALVHSTTHMTSNFTG